MASSDNKWFESYRSLVSRNDNLVKQLIKEKAKNKHLQEIIEKNNRIKYKVISYVDATTQTNGVDKIDTFPATPSVSTPTPTKAYRKSLEETYANPIRSNDLSISIKPPKSIPKKKLLSGARQYFDSSPVNVQLQLPTDRSTPQDKIPSTPSSLLPSPNVTPPARNKKDEQAPSTNVLRYARRRRKEVSYKETPLNVKVRKGFQFFKLKATEEEGSEA